MHSSLPPAEAPRNKLLRVRLTDEEHARLAAVAASRGRSMAEIVRRAIRFAAVADKGGSVGNG